MAIPFSDQIRMKTPPTEPDHLARLMDVTDANGIKSIAVTPSMVTANGWTSFLQLASATAAPTEYRTGSGVFGAFTDVPNGLSAPSCICTVKPVGSIKFVELTWANLVERHVFLRMTNTSGAWATDWESIYSPKVQDASWLSGLYAMNSMMWTTQTGAFTINSTTAAVAAGTPKGVFIKLSTTIVCMCNPEISSSRYLQCSNLGATVGDVAYHFNELHGSWDRAPTNVSQTATSDGLPLPDDSVIIVWQKPGATNANRRFYVGGYGQIPLNLPAGAFFVGGNDGGRFRWGGQNTPIHALGIGGTFSWQF
jgi:hypothetical protein